MIFIACCPFYYRPHPKDGEGTVFSLSVYTSTGVPHLADLGGEYPIPGLDGGYPITGPDRGEVPHPRSGWGVPHPADWGGGTPSKIRTGWYPIMLTGGGTQCKIRMGVPPIETGWRYQL